MKNIVSFDTGDGENDIIFVNADTITHWAPHPKNDGSTVIHFVGGDTLTVQDDVWGVLCQIDPPPARTSVSREIISGKLQPGERVKIRSTLTYADGTVDTTLHDTTFKEYEINKHTGVTYIRCVGGSFNGDRRQDGSFLFDLAEIVNADEVTA